MADREIKQWITVNGKHIPIYEGESKADAVKRATNKQINDDADKKEKQIAENKRQADDKNGKTKPSALTVMKESAKQFTDAKIEARKQGALSIEYTGADGKVYKAWWDGGKYGDKKPKSTALSEKYSKMKGVYKATFKAPKEWRI